MVNGYILSYRNPDTDSVCSSIAYSYYLEKHDKKFIPIITGNISAETAFVLNRANADISLVNHSIMTNDKIILVDTHNISQLPHLPSTDNVIQILDHHPDGDLSLFKNANITNEPIGAVASIVADIIIKEGIMNRSIAILLGSAILSNTVNFSAPSTTSYDKTVFSALKQYYSFSKEYVTEMFQYKNTILQKPLIEVLTSDEKKYIIDKRVIKIAQLELVNVKEVIRFEDVYTVMKYLIQHDELDVYIVSFIDVVNLKSYIIVADDYSSKIVQLIFKQKNENTIYEFNRVVLRKTDIIPKLHDAINGFGMIQEDNKK